MLEALKDDDVDFENVKKIASVEFWDEIYGDAGAIEDCEKLRVLKAAGDELGIQFGAIGFFSFPPAEETAER
jgi:hypothetical protein